MKWSRWEESLFYGHTCDLVNGFDATLSVCPLMRGWEVELFVAFATGDTQYITFHRRDLGAVTIVAAKRSARIWADSVIRGAFLSTEGSNVITGRESSESQE